MEGQKKQRNPSLINEAKFKRVLLSMAHAKGRARFTRVSKATVNQAAIVLRNWMDAHTQRAPGGKTL